VTPERYSQIKTIFQSVLERQPNQRAAYLSHACGNDTVLRSEVEELLHSDENSDTFLETPALTPVSELLETHSTFESLPRHIGPYQVLSILGSGGMGTVCLAIRADDHYKKRVAIKLIRQGLETEAIVERFRRERQIVANLEHPNIAQLLDGGATTDGRPYLVMEYVEGIPIDDYCDQHKLPVAERLRLFRIVCSAVHYAHMNLVVHRDIKPGNILVRQDGTVKLLDFGIAKLLAPEGSPKDLDRTATSLRLMTPQYASPEQIIGDAITTTSDIYLLGLVLYELLTGHRPFHRKDEVTVEVARLLANHEPERPSTAIGRVVESLELNGNKRVTLSPAIVSLSRGESPKLLRRHIEGDLDCIVLKALKRNPAERYGSAEQLSDDLCRHLESEPVLARPRTIGYLITKFAAKNRPLTIAAAAILAVLVAAVCVTTWQARVAGEQRAIAERRFAQVRKVANSFLFEVHDAIAPVPGTTTARRMLVGKALEYLNALSNESATDPVLQGELASAYQRVGDLQGNPNSANLGDTTGALASYRKALSLREALAAGNSANMPLKAHLAASNESLGDMMITRGAPTAALPYYQRAIALCEEAHVTGAQLIDSLHNLAALLPILGRTSEGVAMSLRANEIARNTGDKHLISISQVRLGELLEKTGDLTGALAAFDQALTLRGQISTEDPTNLKTHRELSFIYENLGDVRKKLGNINEANDAYRRSIAIREELAASDPLNTQAQRDLGFAYLNQSSVERTLKAVAIFQTLSARDPANLLARRDLSVAYDRIGTLQAASGQPAAAIENYRRLLQSAQEWVARDPQNLFATQMMATAHLKLGEALSNSGNKIQALQSTQTAFTVFEQLHATDNHNLEFSRGLALSSFAVGKNLCEASRWSEGLNKFEKSTTIVEELRKTGELREIDSKLPREIAAAMNRCRPTPR
jgi:serine/threonine protein kinase